MSSTADECKKKLKNLKDRMREVCSKLPKTRSGQPAFESGETTVRWPHYKPLLFMKDQFIGRPMIGNVEGEGDLECQSILSDDSYIGAESSRTSTPSLPLSTQTPKPKSTEIKKARSKSKRDGMEEEFLAIERGKMESLRMALEMKPEMEQDEWDKFSSSICCDLRKLKDPFIILRVKANIHRQVNDAVLEQLSLDRGANSTSMEYQMNCAQAGPTYYTTAMNYQRRTTDSDPDEIHYNQYQQN